MLQQSDGLRHMVRYGSHNEQKFFASGMSETYEQITFNANLVAWAAGGLAAFLCENELLNRLAFIDPLTHAFQHHPSALVNEDGQVKASVAKLVSAYGEPVISIAGQRALVPNDFNDNGVKRTFVEKVLDFQATTLDREARQADAWPILEFQYGPDLRLSPSLVVFPYFYMKARTLDKWLLTNLDLCRVGLEAEAASGLEKAAQVVIHKEILISEEGRRKIIEGYGTIDTDWILLWVDDLSEHEAGQEELKGLVTLVNGLKDNGKKVVNLYGGFFSILLSHYDVGLLDGVCHGPQYGESRGVVPVGGGLPRARYYLRSLHHRVRFADALRILRQMGWLATERLFMENVCNCLECRRLIEENGIPEGFLVYGRSKPVTFKRGGSTVTMNYPLRETQESATRHYMHSKRWEFRLVTEKSIEEIVERLRRVEEELGQFLGLEAVAHTANWADALPEAR